MDMKSFAAYFCSYSLLGPVHFSTVMEVMVIMIIATITTISTVWSQHYKES